MNRAELVNYLIAARGYRSYLEIGCAGNWTFDQVRAAEKTGVDPVAGGTERCTSDQFFARSGRRFDLVLIDGDHHAAQVGTDLGNALGHLNEGGAIVLHDCLPETEKQQEIGPGGFWIGDGWRAVAALAASGEADVRTGAFDCGCAVVFRRRRRRRPGSAGYHDGATWADYEAHHQEWLGVMDWGALKEWIDRHE